MNKEQSREQYYVQIREPAELRRRILEASKSVIHGLQGYHEFMDRRRRKLELVAKLRTELQEISLLHAKLSSALPAYDLPPEKPKAPVKSAAVKKGPVKKAAKHSSSQDKPRQRTELEKLDDMLSSVEKKLEQVSDS